MAVIQISKIQQRRGQTAQTGFPQLSSGELGWSIDTQELYIGNGSVSEGAPAVGNTQLITEHNIANFFLYAQSGGYTYGSKWDGTSYTSNINGVLKRSIQTKLDDFVNLNDFLPIDATTVTDYTLYFRNAINYASGVGKPLIVPENRDGYVVTGTITIPPNTEIRGAGPTKTVIRNISSTCTFQTVSSDVVPKIGVTGATAIESGSFAPKNIRINGISFINSFTTNASPILQLDCLSDSVIEYCEFVGDDSSLVTTSTASAINFRDIVGYPANTTDNVKIQNNVFRSISSAIVSNYDIANISIVGNKFKTLNKGIVLAETLTGASPQQYGPQHILIEGNTFDTINKQAVYGGSTSTTHASDINSVNNYYYNVGCNSNGDNTLTQVSEVIKFAGFGNFSTGDTFDRLEFINTGTQYLDGSSFARSLVIGPVLLTSKGPRVYDIPGQGVSAVFAIPRSTFQYKTNDSNQLITVDYTINKKFASIYRRGKLEILVDNTTATITDSYTANSDPSTERVTFLATVNTATNLVTLNITNSTSADTTDRGNILYTYTVRQ